MSSVQAGILYFVAYAGDALAFWQSSKYIADTVGSTGGITIGDVYTVILVLVDACVMLGNVAPMMPIFSGAAAAFKRLQEDLNAESKIDATSESGKMLPRGPEAAPLSIDFNNVSFAYPSRPGQSVLRDVDLSFPMASTQSSSVSPAAASPRLSVSSRV